MSDEQTSILIGLLTEIRDELRLVRSTVVPSDGPWDLKETLRDAASDFGYIQLAKMCLSQEEFKTHLQTINQGL